METYEDYCIDLQNNSIVIKNETSINGKSIKTLNDVLFIPDIWYFHDFLIFVNPRPGQSLWYATRNPLVINQMG